jgi:hypothetical protein
MTTFDIKSSDIQDLCNAIRHAGDQSVFDIGFHEGHLDPIADGLASIADSNSELKDIICDGLHELSESNIEIANAIVYLADVIKSRNEGGE